MGSPGHVVMITLLTSTHQVVNEDAPARETYSPSRGMVIAASTQIMDQMFFGYTNQL
jgi:hypothetical protein